MNLVFSDCTIHFRGVWSTQPAADEEGFPCFGTKETFSARDCVGLHFFLTEACPVLLRKPLV